MKCKIITAVRPLKLESHINEWLEENPKIEIRFVQFESTVMAIFYEEQ